MRAGRSATGLEDRVEDRAGLDPPVLDQTRCLSGWGHPGQ